MDTDDLPVFNRSAAPHGGPANPHIVRSATALRCEECGVDLGAAWLFRACASLVRTEGVEP